MSSDAATYTEGVCADGAAILKHGNMMPIDEVLSTLNAAEARIAELEFEVMVLRMYGNKDCTAMADEQIAKKRAGQKCDFED